MEKFMHSLTTGSEDKDEDIPSSDSEAQDVDERPHARLLDAISSLDGNKRLKHTLRGVHGQSMSESGLTSQDVQGETLLSELMGSLHQSASHSKMKKQLRATYTEGSIVETPAPKHIKEKVQRTVGFEKAVKEISKWDPVVSANRKAPQLKFPLEQPTKKLVNTHISYRPVTSLDKDIQAVLAKVKPENKIRKGAVFTPAEERQMAAMSLEEAKARRAELLQMRAIMYTKNAKLRWQNKIKSKRYRRALKKEKEKKAEKELEELALRDPQALVDKMEEADKKRILERGRLRHMGGGKFAREAKIFAKYDDQKRQDLQNMLEKHRKLKEKATVEYSSSSDDEDEEPFSSKLWTTQRSVDDIQNDVTGNDNRESVTEFDTKEVTEDDAPFVVEKVSEENEHIVSEKDTEGDAQLDVEKDQEEDEPIVNEKDMEDVEKDTDKDAQDTKQKKKKKKQKKQEKQQQEKQQQEKQQQEKKQQEKQQQEKKQQGKQQQEKKQQGKQQQEKKQQGKQEKQQQEKKQQEKKQQEKQQQEQKQQEKKKQQKKKQQEKKQEDSKDQDKQQDQEKKMKEVLMTIDEAFDDDDVVADFIEEKQQAIEDEMEKDIDTFLPGWGSWAGAGIEPSQKLRQKFIIKATPTPRKDNQIGHVVISNKKNQVINKHKLENVPYPYRSEKHIKQVFSKPIVKPKRKIVVNRIGQIIEPISESTLLHGGQKRKPADMALDTSSMQPSKKKKRNQR